ncbi:gp44 [Listeria phage P35]|uniref:gp44 n=1 Tax=Listeria phage P35 TaxID=330398 RepID=UPI00015C025E|nr:gp44 [Listeria phage P35]AAY53229.1 gp44 [Listeria phage P35]
MEKQYYRVGYYANGEWQDCFSNSGNIFNSIESAVRAKKKQERAKSYSFAKLEIGLFTFAGALDDDAIQSELAEARKYSIYLSKLHDIFNPMYWNTDDYRNIPYHRAFRLWKNDYEKEQAND